MRRKILASFLILAVIMISAFVWIANKSIHDTLEKQVTQSLIHELGLVTKLATAISWDDNAAQDFLLSLELADEQRLTIIDNQGVVLADSFEDPLKMDNHLRRPEISDAIEKKSYGTAVRYSETVKQEFIYTAVSINHQGKDYFLRLSKPVIFLKEFNRTITQTTAIALLVVGSIVILMGVFLAKWLTDPIKRLNSDVLRIAEGAYGQAVYTAQSDEIGQLGDSFNQMRQSLLDAMKSSETRNAVLKAILNKIGRAHV